MARWFLQYFICGHYMILTNALSILTGSPQQAVIGQNVNITLKCVVDIDNTLVSWFKDGQPVGNIQVDSSGNCTGMPLDTPYIFKCYPTSRTYYLILQLRNLTESENSVEWRCFRLFGHSSFPWNISIAVPVTRSTITPTGINNVAGIVVGSDQTFTCSTDSSRPAASIQWYIGGENVTNQAQPQTPQPEGDKFISYSRMVYTGKDADHGKNVYCEAVNIDGRDKVKSIEISIYIQLPVTTVSIAPTGNNNVAGIVVGSDHTFTCSTDSSRPAASIQWYIGGENVTNQAQPQTPQPDGDKFISSSRLVYTGKDADHDKDIYCEAVTIEGRDKVKSTNELINIFVPVTTVTITPAGINNVADIVVGDKHTFSCSTDSSRPAAWIQWYIRGENVTDLVQPQTPQQDGNKFISSSRLVYTGKDADHGKDIYCEALNIEGRDKVKSTIISIYIQIKPFLDNTRPYSPTYVSATENNTLHLRLTIHANPTPTVEWTFRPEANWNSCDCITIVSNTTTNGFLTSSSILIDKVQRQNFGDYTFTANNTVGIFFRRFLVMEEASLRQEMFANTNGNTGMFVAGIVTLVVGLFSLTASTFFVVRNSLRNKTLRSCKCDKYIDVQRNNPAFTDTYTTVQSDIESRALQEQIINTYEECGRTPDARAYSSVDKMESEPNQPQQHGVNTYEECGKRIEAHAYDTLDK